MLPKSDQPGQLYGTSKTHKFTKIDEVTVDNLKFRPIIAQSGAYIYNAAQAIVEYLKLLKCLLLKLTTENTFMLNLNFY